MRMLKTLPFYSPKSGENPYLEVFSRFGLWRDFLNDNIQQEPITRSVQLPYFRATAFSQVELFLDMPFPLNLLFLVTCTSASKSE